ncbi:MAG: hypothetical protein JSU77_02440 [Fidelibacterota bacterium]|nr:MAG: hypothetical protein JSU77_02440 [Candidatus Neomarinimicrobiota bacterium]
MAGRKLLRSALLLLCGIWLTGCVSYAIQRDNPRFAGYHQAKPSRGVTAAIIDRETLIPPAAPIRQPSLVHSRAEEAPEDRDYTYQDWYRNRYRDNDAFQFNLSYHLYGPYHYRDFQSRYWLQYQRRWQRLPWYAGRWYDPWRDYSYWHDPWYDPWYSFYDPWYGFYDPWYGYYDPWHYGHSYSYYGGGYGWHPWYGTRTTRSVQTKATERRLRGRRDLPTGLAPISGSDIPTVPLRTRSSSAGSDSEKSADKGKAAASKSDKSKPKGTLTRLFRGSRKRDSGSSSASSSGQTRSSSRSTSTTRSSSKSSGKSSNAKSSRPRSRKP